MKADPYAFHAETRPGTASKVYETGKYRWNDSTWKKANSGNILEKPVNIYEIHFGSWKRHENGDFLSYRQMAEELVPYVKDMGYTHIEMMPIMEYPLTAHGDIRLQDTLLRLHVTERLTTLCILLTLATKPESE